MSTFAQVGDFCPNTACADHGTLFYRRRTPENEIIETLALIAEVAISAVWPVSKVTKRIPVVSYKQWPKLIDRYAGT
jgi:hypothetical protein